tara:strand:- start:270 stop:1070 length:801 start_codon:yes stop_codon:yes gene_type:complete
MDKKIFKIDNKQIALVTGASGPVGNSIVKALSYLGYDLILTDFDERKIKKLAAKLKKKFHNKILTYACDLRKPAERSLFLSWVNKKTKKINLLINNAAITGSASDKGWNTKFNKQNPDLWSRTLEVNLTSIFHITKELEQKLKKSKNAKIINIGSIYGFLGPDWKMYEKTNLGNPAAYSASKGGLIQLTKWLAVTLGPDVRVNCISPGGIKRNQNYNFVKKYIDKTPLKRMATENDIVGAVIFLSSDLSKYITGHNLVVDGGYSAS